ncbi:uncharacterized protein LOC112575002 isoform X1 [Pomacea canaliculata]|uniref:uncharacterized protein LOC112575002 isoform X1 n=1 Tax=Pomacea canaliculata TaxID=400727 RepID=UPI000D733AB5|nr:uncharacterized protein LOC112575002 isoform X1 [Pomacea canaliculata]
MYVRTTMTTKMNRKIKLLLSLILLGTTCVVLMNYIDITNNHVTWLSFLKPESRDRLVSEKHDDDITSLYLQRWEVYKTAKEHFANRTCDNKDVGPCVDPACNTTFLPPRARLQRLVSTQYNVSSRHLEVLSSLGARVPPADLVFLTAASEDHFDESQGVIRDLHEKVFPWLSNNTNYTYNLIYYDLGLANKSLALLTKYCRCHVLSFPFQSLPEVFKNLRTYQWKPLLVKAHSSHSKLLMWMDASVRFKSGDVSLIIQRVMADGFFIQHHIYMMPRHVMPVMLQYFHTEACLLAPFYEVEANFFVVKNEPLMSKAVLDPWVACAFAPRCVYPGDDWRKLLACFDNKRGYSVCHRFDQSALGVILVTLFDFKLSHLVVPDNNVNICRENKVKYFPNTL